ncbi:hypothetical protein [Dyadobacter aurulentus]|uniref:hypothetical protein n=1 Tax=Dyadobacter sp. UC 10 TaxID=2605428 RepID=UPI0011F27C16|nr:hypothetical protein [Dyadobacter sp. UC 10]KAA0992871.1 hypothetical protein FXO21_23205 [Dyadobacter sp. UC 10]
MEEKNHDTLKNALARLPGYTPAPGIWDAMQEQLAEAPLRAAIGDLPQHEPDEKLWDLIERKVPGRKVIFRWPYAAAVLLAGFAGIWIWRTNTQPPVLYSQIQADQRLQASPVLDTDVQYEKLKAYCETENIVCNSGQYKQLSAEFEDLHAASAQLQEAIGSYNTEPELVKQLNSIEKQKAAILNEMAKMI